MMQRSNPPMTAGQRRGWLATWLQQRRRARAAALVQVVPAILLASDGHGRLTWTLNFTTDYGLVNIYQSNDGVTWDSAPFDSWNLADGNRDCSGASGYFRICVCDDNGNDLPPYSNAVYSDGL
jgi:hypothetical protein